jgi:hypothetical protein
MTSVLGADVAGPTTLSKLGEDLADWIEKANNADFVKSLENVEKLKEIRTQIAEQLEQLKSASESGLKALRQEADLGAAMTPEQMSRIQSWTSWQGKLGALTNKLDTITPGVFETIHAGVGAIPTGKEDEKKKASVPDPEGPNQSVQPPAPVDPH